MTSNPSPNTSLYRKPHPRPDAARKGSGTKPSQTVPADPARLRKSLR